MRVRRLLGIEGNNAVLEADKALHDTRSAGADAEELERQLRQLVNVCANESVRAKLGDNAATLETQLNNSIAALNAAREQKTGARGTPAETEYLDLLDGLAVELVRLARKAARAVARDLVQEAIAIDLDLRELYQEHQPGHERRGRRRRRPGRGLTSAPPASPHEHLSLPAAAEPTATRCCSRWCTWGRRTSPRGARPAPPPRKAHPSGWPTSW